MSNQLEAFMAHASQQFLTGGQNPLFDQGFLSAFQAARDAARDHDEPVDVYRAMEIECPEPWEEDVFLGYIVAENMIFGYLEGCRDAARHQDLRSGAPRAVSAQSRPVPSGPPVTVPDIEVPGRIPAPAARIPAGVEVVCKPRKTFDDLIGLDEAKGEMAFALKLILEPEFASQTGLKPAGGILLHGPPGNGKTSFAEAAAGTFNVTFLRVHASEVHNKYVGESEKSVHHIFEYARTQVPCILYIDELDSLLPSRDGLGNSQHMASVVNQFLTELGGMGQDRGREPIVLGATNRLDAIDDAAIRSGRFDAKILVPAPVEAERVLLLRRFLSTWRLGDKVDIARWAELTEGWAVADLEALAQKAARHALKAGCKPTELVITNSALTQAASEIRTGLCGPGRGTA